MQNLKIKTSLFLNYFVFAILLNSVGTVILLCQTYFKVDEKQVAYLDPFKDISIAVAAFVVGGFITKIGYKKSMLIALASIAIVCFIVPFIKLLIAVKVLLAVCGFAFGLTKVSVFGAIGIISKNEKEHLSIMSFIESFFMTGVLCGYFLFAFFSKNPETGNWFTSYYFIGGLATVSFFILLSASLDESSLKLDDNSSAVGFKEMTQLVLLPMIWSFVICAFFYVLIEQSTMNWLPTFNKKVLNISEPIAIMLASILSATIMFGRFFAGLLFKRLNWFVVLAGCVIGAAIVLLISLHLAGNTNVTIKVEKYNDVPLVAYIFPLIGLFLSPIYPAINSLILSALPKAKHGAMSGLIVVFSAIGGTLGSVIAGYLFKEIGGIPTFYFSLVPLIILIAGLSIFRKFRKQNQVYLADNIELSGTIGH